MLSEVLLQTLLGSVVVQDGCRLVTEYKSRPLMACLILMALVPLLSHMPVSGCQHLTRIQSSCSDTTFAQAIQYRLAGNGTLACTDRYWGVFFMRSLWVTQVLNADVNVFNSSCYVPFAVPGHFLKCNVNYQIPSRKLQITLWQTFYANYDKICQRNIDLPVFYTSPTALQQNFDDNVNLGLLRVVKHRSGANRWRVLFLVLIRAIIKLIINTIRYHMYWLSTQYEIVYFGLQHKHDSFVQINSRDFTTA